MLEKITLGHRSDALKKLIMERFSLTEEKDKILVNDLDQIIFRYLCESTRENEYFVKLKHGLVHGDIEDDAEKIKERMERRNFEDIFNAEARSVKDRMKWDSFVEIDFSKKQKIIKDILDPIDLFVENFVSADKSEDTRIEAFNYQNMTNISKNILLDKNRRFLGEIKIPIHFSDNGYKSYFAFQLVNDVENKDYLSDGLNYAMEQHLDRYFDSKGLDARFDVETENPRIIIYDANMIPELIFETDHNEVVFSENVARPNISLEEGPVAEFVRKIQARIYAGVDITEKLSAGDVVNSFGDRLTIDSEGLIGRDDDLPSVITSEGDKEWRKAGVITRENDEPAIIWSYGAKEWVKKGLRDRKGDPAVMTKDFKNWQWMKSGHKVKTAFIAESKNEKEKIGIFLLMERYNEIVLKVYDENGKNLTTMDIANNTTDMIRYPRYSSVAGFPLFDYFSNEEVAEIDTAISREIAKTISTDTSLTINMKDGLIHADGKPAIVSRDGSLYAYFTNGFLNRPDGPAFVVKGNEYWMKNGVSHRIGGPAVINTDGYTEYWKDGEWLDNSDETTDDATVEDGVEETPRFGM